MTTKHNRKANLMSHQEASEQFISFEGELRIDRINGKIYFDEKDTGATLLRIGNLPGPIPNPGKNFQMLDIVHKHGQNWGN